MAIVERGSVYACPLNIPVIAEIKAAATGAAGVGVAMWLYVYRREIHQTAGMYAHA